VKFTGSRAGALLLLLAPVVVARAAPGTRIAISATPRQLELAPGARATLRISSPETPLLSASVGAIEGLHAVGKGAFEATYVPPRETYPQVAIIAAIAGGRHGWLQLPLAGTGEVAVKPDANGTATVTIGNRRFGPQRAGPDGRVHIKIVVPPGARHAVSGGKRMNLNSPAVPHVFVVVGRSAVPADEGATLLVQAFAVTPEGKPRRRARLQLEASSGQLTSPRELEPGFFEARWKLPIGAAGSATVEARLADEKQLASQATVQRDAAQARKMLLDVDRERVAAGDGAFDFALTFLDASGRPVDGASPRVALSAGTFLGWTRGMPGRWRGHVAVPERLNGTSKLVIDVTAGDLEAHREVNLVPGPTADLAVSSGISRGKGLPLMLSVSTVDRFGNPTDDAPPQSEATLGTLEAPVRQGLGLYQVVYHPPAKTDASSDEVTIRAGRAETITRVRFYGSLVSLLTVGVKGGAARRSGKLGPVAGLDASLWTRAAGNRLGLVVDGSWFNFSQTLTATNGSESLPLDSGVTYLAFTVGPTWRQPIGRRVMLWASVGGGLAHVANSSKLAGQPAIDESAWVPAGTAALSIGLKALRGYPFLELRGTLVGNPHLTSLVGSFTPVFLQLGYRFDAL
jgi:hypothetical protein